MNNLTLKDICTDCTVEMYDSTVAVADILRQKGASQITVFTKKAQQHSSDEKVLVRSYRAVLEAADCVTDVCVLDNKAVKVLMAMYPSAPKYVLVRLSFNSGWVLGLPGLVRRIIVGLVRVRGFVTVTDASGSTYRFLVLEQDGGIARKVPTLPKAIGIPKFLQWLKDNNINYVVLRFYERLPQLYREGGDLDILLPIEDKRKVEAYLQENAHLLSDGAGDIRLGLHSASGEHGIVPYYPPPLARQILENAIDGPAHSRIPALRDAFLSFIYHALYHAKKGYAAGIPSALKKHTDPYPENDYKGVILEMAEKLNIPFDETLTMEQLDDYMAEEGWRPKLDTLAKIGETNAWVRDRFFAPGQHGPAGLAVFMLREWAYDQDITQEVLSIIEEEGFIVLRKKELSAEERVRATADLRGGTWGQDANGSETGWGPAYAIVVVDQKSVNMPPAYASGFERFRIRNLKTRLRNRFDDGARGSVHSTDETRESWEYIEVCFPDEMSTIRAEVEDHARTLWIKRITRFLSPTYLKHSLRYSLREFFIERFLQ